MTNGKEVPEVLKNGRSLGRALRDLDGDEGPVRLGGAVANMMNGLHMPPDAAGQAIARGIKDEHRTLQQMAIGALLAAIVEYGQTSIDFGTDLRNEAGVRVCRKIADLVQAGELKIVLPLV